MDSRTLVSAWRRAGGGAGADLARDDAIALARRLGAGQLVLGEVVSLPGRVVLTASLHDVVTGEAGPPITVEERLNRLPSLVDGLVAGLLSVEAGEGERLTSLTTTSLPALRLYLEGQAAYRGGRPEEAFSRFARAVETDTTFALAALMANRAASWLEGEEQLLALSWRHRERLSRQDRVFLDAAIGPNYPEPSSGTERLLARQTLVEQQPDNPEAWFWLGDMLAHFGALWDIPDSTAVRSATRAFHRSLELDPNYLPALTHLVDRVGPR